MTKNSIDTFRSFVSEHNDDFLNTAKATVNGRGEDFCIFNIPLSTPRNIEDVMDFFEDDLEIIMLYHYIPSQVIAAGESACAYSNPVFGQMFKIYGRTGEHGLVRNVLVTLYESLDIMCGDVCRDLAQHSKGGGQYCKYFRKKEEVLLDFV